jgi:signal transduction histidine kinase
MEIQDDVEPPIIVSRPYVAAGSPLLAAELTEHDGATLDVVATAAAQPLRAARLEDQLAVALDQLGTFVGNAETVERVKTDVLLLASHELRTPLTVLHGYLSLVREGFFGDIPEPLNGVLTILARRTDEMNSLVNDMLVAARLEDGPGDGGQVATDLRDLVREAANAVAPRASAVHRLRVEVPLEVVTAMVNTESVTRAVRNLVDNAVKYSPGGGDVVCRLFADGERACVRVSDHGLGIDPADRGRLFTRFGRVVTSANSHIPGIGLGLYFSREVARRHGGDVNLVDHAGSGSVFELTLPLA